MTDSGRTSAYVTHSMSERMALALVDARWQRGGRVIRSLIIVLLLLAAALLLGFVAFVSQLDNSESEPMRHADAIVVLTGGADRIPDAVQLLAEGHGTRLLISGVNKDLSPGNLLKLLPQYADLFACCIDLDYGAGNTVGNATETRRWARDHKVGSIILVTSNYHMPRAMIEFRRAMPQTDFIARPVVPYAFDASRWWRDASVARVLAAEYVKFLAAWGRSVAAPVIGENIDSTGSVKHLATF
jgi:uncharacterized SAM-binding protein YcdF (DUF218 family)